MASGESGRLGRQLLATRNLLRDEDDPIRRRKLLRREVRLLVELDNLPAAEAACRKLMEENPGWPAAFSMLADIACREGEWEKAEELFGRSAQDHERSGDAESAERIRTGPLYRLAEAREDRAACRELCSGGGELAGILLLRTARLAGSPSGDIPADVEDWLARRLAELESGWRGAPPAPLLDTALQWRATEPEWRWRFIVEGIHLWRRNGLDTRPWDVPLKDTARPVLDPRFRKEWRDIGQ